MNELDLERKFNIISHDMNIKKQIIIDTYFFEQFLKLLANSSYRNSMVIKGGFLLQNLIGIQTRTTLDIDFEYLGSNLSIDEIEKMFKEICSSSNSPSISILNISDIKKNDQYGGKRIKLLGKIGHFKKVFSVDIACGDTITPSPVLNCFKTLFSDEKIELLSYNFETIISEKIHALIENGLMNSRMKDYFDIYTIVNFHQLDYTVLSTAIINTFFRRKRIFSINDLTEIIEKIANSNFQRSLFTKYISSRKDMEKLSFESVISTLRQIVKKIEAPCLNIENINIQIQLVRHGEDEQNRLGGWSSNQLTEIGVKQIEKFASEIDDSYDDILSSDLPRAKQSAQIIANQLTKGIIYFPQLRETNNGDLKDLTIDQFHKQYPTLFHSNLKMDTSYPNGESPNEFFFRVKNAFLRILNDYNNKKIMIVTHGGVITVILCLINGYQYSNLLKLYLPYASSISIKINDSEISCQFD